MAELMICCEIHMAPPTGKVGRNTVGFILENAEIQGL